VNEKTIYLETVEPVEIFGVNNVNLDRIKSYFPKLKFIARGNELKIVGPEEEIVEFEKNFQMLMDYYLSYNRLQEEDIEQLLFDPSHRLSAANGDFKEPILFGNSGKPIFARTVNQVRLVKENGKNDLILVVGPAGTGKTYTAIALAVRSLRNKQVKRIVLTRPAVEAGEHLGFLPGDLKEKLDPYLQPLYDALNDMIPSKKLANNIEDGSIHIAPLAFMRGRTLENAFVILDEGQNATVNQLKMFLTRMGHGSKFIVTGDITQIDLPYRRDSGLLQAMRILKNIEGISTVEFDVRDIVRHRLVKDIVDAYEKSKNNGTSKEEKGKSM
jgi:phosphate starvation-inducible PhoH-like protein